MTYFTLTCNCKNKWKQLIFIFWLSLKCIFALNSHDKNHTYPIIPERTCGYICILSSSSALGGFQIKVMEDVFDIKPCLQRGDRHSSKCIEHFHMPRTMQLTSVLFVVGSQQIFMFDVWPKHNLAAGVFGISDLLFRMCYPTNIYTRLYYKNNYLFLPWNLVLYHKTKDILQSDQIKYYHYS